MLLHELMGLEGPERLMREGCLTISTGWCGAGGMCSNVAVLQSGSQLDMRCTVGQLIRPYVRAHIAYGHVGAVFG
jgi:hypothetical protein